MTPHRGMTQTPGMDLPKKPSTARAGTGAAASVIITTQFRTLGMAYFPCSSRP